MLVDEKQILATIESETGLTYPRLGSITIGDQRTADTILPIVRKLRDDTCSAGVRATIDCLFDSPFGRTYLNDILEWWKTEDDLLNQDLLAQLLIRLCNRSLAERIWEVAKDAERTESWFSLLARLASFPSITSEAASIALALLNEAEDLPISILREIARIKDPRIQAWFLAHKASADPDIRQVAAELARRKRKLPDGLRPSVEGPDLRLELVSTEIDLINYASVLRELSKEYSFNVPKRFYARSWLADLVPDRWYRLVCETGDARTVSLWFRVEDIDILEIALTKP